MNLSPTTKSHWVTPHYIGGPRDGGFGELQEAADIVGVIRLPGGDYQMCGFQHSRDWIEDICVAIVTPDRVVYQWEPSPCRS